MSRIGMAGRETVEALRRQVAAIERAGDGTRPLAGRRLPVDHGPVDAALGGGLAAGVLHEILPAAVADSAAAGGFALALSLCLAPAERPLVWIRAAASVRESGELHPDGLAALGLDPARLILVRLGDAASILRAGVEVARCAALGAVIVELYGDPKALDLTSERRLMLAAEQSGVSVILLRPGAKAAPGGAETRWRLASGPTRPLPMNAPGPPTFDLTLVRHRHGPPGGPWRLEWNRDAKRFEPLHFATETIRSDPDALPRVQPAAPLAGRALWRHAG
ncbi:hypothetical protein LB518_06240 [Mesorhizobium sp. BR1-1-16]|uniref:ImuA family protein n=1 Tax=Mesorhizobium sp. BR1-1-16 TaxID=2876653 RepID=UPI001CCCC431|nr:hypothetical protein [Mesorhizobium sp. BR1-1-16]MBZ9935883.1 hypothetical protein [Mesorhizobium sp. BR1-1-16]